MIRNSGIQIDKSKISLQDLNKIKNDLTQRSYDFKEKGKFEEINYFWEHEDKIYVPRNFLLNSSIQNELEEGKEIKLEYNKKFQFRDQIQEEAVNQILGNNEILINLVCGKGKTIIGAAAATKLNRRTVIIVDKLVLVTQWINAFKKVSNIKEKQFGSVGKKGYNWSDINIMTIQSITSKLKKDPEKFRDEFIKAQIGLTIIDELHCVIGPKEYTKFLYTCNSRKLVGMSATPFRNKQRKKIITYWLSDKIYQDNVYDLIPKVLQYDINKFVKKEEHKYFYLQFKFDPVTKKSEYAGWKFDKLKYLKKLSKDPEYIKLICDFVERIYNKKRTVIVMGIIIELLTNVKKELLKRGFKDYMIGDFYGKGDLDQTKCQIILATYSKCEKGVDVPVVDTLILGHYIRSAVSCEQSIGRILRDYDGKSDPVVLDIVDRAHKDVTDAWDTRYEFYKEMNFNVVKLKN